MSIKWKTFLTNKFVISLPGGMGTILDYNVYLLYLFLLYLHLINMIKFDIEFFVF